MPFISDSLRAQVKKDFDRVLLSEVKIVHFTQYESSPETPLLVFQSQRRQYYEETRALLHELADLSDKLHLEIHELAADPEGAAQYRIDKIPATVLAVGPNHRIRFFGLPTGTQFGLLVDAIGDLSRGGVSLSEATTETLKALLNEAHIQVFLTSNWPVGPRAARVACQFALASPSIRTDVIEVMEFPELAMRYGVLGSPTTVVNESARLRGPISEGDLLGHILRPGGS